MSDAHPERVATLRRDLHAWYRDVGAQFLRPLEGGPEAWHPARHGGANDARTVTLGDDLEVERLSEGVWLHRSFREVEGFGRVPANGLVVVSDGEAALVDTPWTDPQTRALVSWVRHGLGAQVTTVVPTHSHGDCMGGLGASHELGARSYALATTVSLARRDGLPVPEEAFEGERGVVVGEREMTLLHPGAGHTVDNIVVWVPDVKVLFGGDAVRSQSLGFIGEADLEAWPATVAALESAFGEARVVVPGHGAPGGPELLEGTRALLEAAPR